MSDTFAWGDMSTAIVRALTPEEREYARYLAEIEERKRRVAELRAELESLKLSVGRFDIEYHARIGTLFAEIDRIRLAIEEYEQRISLLTADPHANPTEIEREISDQFGRQSEEVRAEEEETRRYEQAHQREQELPELGPDAEERAKRLYRELAKRFHPDLARTEDERRNRETVMQRVNAAFRSRDVAALEAMSAEAEVTDAAFEARSIGEKLVWAIREVARLDNVRTALQTEIDATSQTEIYVIWRRQEEGELVIERLETELERDLMHERDRLAALVDTYGQLVELKV